MSFLLPKFAIAPSSIIAGATSAASSHAPLFHVQQQQQNEWCWAAVSASVAAFFGSSSWSQCKVASAELSLPCCVDPLPGGCNRPWSLDTALQTVGHFARMSTGSLSFASIRQQIAAAAPVGVRIVWAGSAGAHFIAVAGWLVDPSGIEFVDISDPWYGDAQVKYSDVLNAYKTPGDNWSHTYFTSRIGAVVGGAVASSPLSA